MINKIKIKATFLHTPFLSRLKFIPFFLTLLSLPPLPQGPQDNVDGRLCNNLSLSVLPPHAVPLLQHRDPATGDSPS